jgi:hypothetical protein
LEAQSRIRRLAMGFRHPAGRERAASYGTIASVIYVAAFVYTMVRVPPALKNKPLSLESAAVIAFAFIVLAPPIWFFFESIVLYGPGHGGDQDYTHSEELASRVWLAFSAIAAIYLFHGVG